MANSAKLEDNFELPAADLAWTEALKERLEQLDEEATRSQRIATQRAKRKRAAMTASLRDALQALQAQEEQLQARVATVQQRETELSAREALLNNIEHKFESQLERLSQFKLDAANRIDTANVKLHKSQGAELAETIAKSVGERVANLLGNQAAANQEAAASEAQKQVSLLESRLNDVQQAKELLHEAHELLKQDLADTQDELQLLRLQSEEQAREQVTQAELATQRAELVELLQCELKELQSELKTTASELKQTRTELTASQAELTASQAELTAAQAELTAAQLKLTAAQSELTAAQSEFSTAQSELSELQAADQANRTELAETTRELAAAHGEIESLRSELLDLQSQLEQSRTLAECNWSSGTDSSGGGANGTGASETGLITSDAAEASQTIARLQQQLEESEEFARMLQEELLAARETAACEAATYELTQHRDADAADWSVAARGSASDQALIEELQAEIASLQVTLMAVRADDHTHDTSTESVSLACEVADLKQQNADLAAQLAKLQMSGNHNPPHLNLCQESMTWEERKRLILQQLEEESSDFDSPETHRSRVEISEVLNVTQAELERRDREIAELQSIIEQQSNTREGVAIGAAAIAQMLDSDELLQQERERLRAIQQEWEDKLRNAEIEMSLERAKLARERAQLEERLRAQLESKPEEPPKAAAADDKSTDPKAAKPTRKWLEHLGLKDR